jgi:protease I
MRLAIILETDFRDEEAIYPMIRMKEEGFDVEIFTDKRKIAYGKFGFPIQGTSDFKDLKDGYFDGIIIPGGNEGPDRLRMNQDVLEFVKKMFDSGKLVSAICHGVWIPISAKIMKGKQATCYKAIIDDLINAGAFYKDDPVVVDGNIITSRHPKDLGEFCKAIIAYLKANAPES